MKKKEKKKIAEVPPRGKTTPGIIANVNSSRANNVCENLVGGKKVRKSFLRLKKEKEKKKENKKGRQRRRE